MNSHSDFWPFVFVFVFVLGYDLILFGKLSKFNSGLEMTLSLNFPRGADNPHFSTAQSRWYQLIWQIILY